MVNHVDQLGVRRAVRDPTGGRVPPGSVRNGGAPRFLGPSHMCYDSGVHAEEISLRELRNNVSAVLRRVEAGERLRVTVDRRPVAELIPLSRRRASMRWSELEPQLEGIRADAGLADDLRTAFPDTTDDL